jgi:outer membrane protein TolC
MSFDHCGPYCAAALLGLFIGSAAAAPPEPAPIPPPKGETSKPPPLVPSLLDDAVRPIDLAAALQLAGVQNPEIMLARERVTEAVALRQFAAAQILPTINAGTDVNVHDGPLQRSTGVIQKVDRGSLYLGLGAGAVGAGTVQIPGLVWNGNVSKVWFDALVSRQVVRQRQFASEAVRNDILLRVADGYLELLRAEGRRAVALQIRDDAAELARVTANFANTGEGRKADADRAATELDQRNSDLVEAENAILTASARLCELLDLDPSTRLHATDGWVVPSPIVPDPVPLPELLAIALTRRPELGERQAAIRAALLALEDAKLLPFSPNVVLGYSAGTFGGGSNLASDGSLNGTNGKPLFQPRFDSFAPREDFDAVVYWSLRNLGLGNVAEIRWARSNLRSEDLRRLEVLNRVRSEVARAYAATHARYAQIETAERAVKASKEAFREDFLRTRNKEGLPIEVIDSLRLLGRSRNAYLDAIIDYNRAQFALYVSLGQPPARYLARPVPADLVPPPEPPMPPAPPK